MLVWLILRHVLVLGVIDVLVTSLFDLDISYVDC